MSLAVFLSFSPPLLLCTCHILVHWLLSHVSLRSCSVFGILFSRSDCMIFINLPSSLLILLPAQFCCCAPRLCLLTSVSGLCNSRIFIWFFLVISASLLIFCLMRHCQYTSFNSDLQNIYLFVAAQALRCCVWASHCGGLSSSEVQTQQLCMGLVALWHVGSSLIRDWTRVLCIGRPVLIHWTTREAFPSILYVWFPLIFLKIKRFEVFSSDRNFRSFRLLWSLFCQI